MSARITYYGDKRGGHIRVAPLSSFWIAWYCIGEDALRWTGTGNSANEAVASLWYQMHKWSE